MKTIFSFFVFLLSSILFSQEYKSMLIADNYWQVSDYMHTEQGDTEFIDYQYLLTGETMVYNEKEFIRLKSRKRYRMNNTPTSNWRNWEFTDFYLSENIEERKVYIYYNESFIGHDSGEFLLYDFNMEIGDFMTFEGFMEGQSYDPLEVLSITNEEIYGQSHKVFHFSSDSEYPFSLMEGIGTTFGINTLSYWDGGFILTDFGQNLSTTEISLLKAKVYPNPFTSQIQIESKKPIQKLQLFDVIGKLIYCKSDVYGLNSGLNQLESGVYILTITYQDDEKETVKLIKK